jgi:hypothetical protein
MKRVYTIVVGALVFGLLWGTAVSSMACKAAGKNKHVGVVMNIDQKAGTFTIKDAETQHLLTFQATGKQLQEIRTKDQVMVSYKENGGRLIALDIHS